MSSLKKVRKRTPRYSPADIAALRFIQKNGRTKANPNGFTNGEKLLLTLLVKLARKKGHSYATNAKLGEMLGGKTAASVKATLTSLRRRGFVIQYQLGSQHGLAYRELVLTPEKRQRMVDVYGEPSEANNYWWFILSEGEEIPNYNAVSLPGSGGKSDTDCVGSDSVLTNDNYPLLSGQGRERREKPSASSNHEPHPGTSPTPSPAKCRTKVFARDEVPPRAVSGAELTHPASIPDRVRAGCWLSYLVGTPELQVFLRLYGDEATIENESFLRSLGRSIRRGRFYDSPDLFNYIRQLSIPQDAHGKFMAPCELLRRLTFLAHDYVLENGFCRYTTLTNREVEMEKDAATVLARFDDYTAAHEDLPLKPLQLNRQVLAPYVYDLDTRKAWMPSAPDHVPEWCYFLHCVQSRPEFLTHWTDNPELRQRLVASLLTHAAIVPVLDTMLGGQLATYTGHANEILTAAHANALAQVKQAKLDLYRSNNLSVYFQQSQTQHLHAA